jgi:hypothetical protein
MRIVALVALGLIATGLLSGPVRAESVPPQLRNKTISLAWTMQRTVMTPRGERQSPPFQFGRTIYVSGAGRFFVKASRNGHNAEVAPGDRTPQGGARDMRFSGGKVVAMAQRGTGAGRMIISFDQNYTSCRVHINYGKPAGGHASFTSRRGVEIEVLDVVYSGQSCSIRDGNAFAN